MATAEGAVPESLRWRDLSFDRFVGQAEFALCLARHRKTVGTVETTLVLWILAAGTVLAVLLTQTRQVLDQIPEVVDAWHRAMDALRRRRTNEDEPPADDSDEDLDSDQDDPANNDETQTPVS